MLTTRAFTGTPSLASSRLNRKAVVVKCVAQPRRAAAAGSQGQTHSCSPSAQAPLLAAGALLAPYVLDVTASLAAGGELGLLEGRYVAFAWLYVSNTGQQLVLVGHVVAEHTGTPRHRSPHHTSEKCPPQLALPSSPRIGQLAPSKQMHDLHRTVPVL